MAKIKGETGAQLKESQRLRLELDKYGWSLWGQKHQGKILWRLRNVLTDAKLYPNDLSEIALFLKKLQIGGNYGKDKNSKESNSTQSSETKTH